MEVIWPKQKYLDKLRNEEAELTQRFLHRSGRLPLEMTCISVAPHPVIAASAGAVFCTETVLLAKEYINIKALQREIKNRERT